MRAIAALDLRGGACVQLVGGRTEEERLRRPDPRQVLEELEEAGFALIHVVDLDAALGEGSNAAIIGDLLRCARVPLQIGGGIRDDAAVIRLLDAGADMVVVGTRAVEEPGWLEAAAMRHHGRLILAADVRGEDVVVRGWTHPASRPVAALLQETALLPLGGVLATAVHVEGALAGPDLALVRELAALTPHPLLASGGIRSLADLRQLAAAGAAGAVIGMALYTGALDGRAATREFP